MVGDIDRGGVFAAFVGTLALLSEEDAALVGIGQLIIDHVKGAVYLA